MWWATCGSGFISNFIFYVHLKAEHNSIWGTRHQHLGLTRNTSFFWSLNTSEEAVLSWGVWTALLRSFMKVHTKLKQLIGCARERMAAPWELIDILMIMWIVVSEVVKTFPLKWKYQEMWEQKSSQESWETVGVRGRQMIKKKKKRAAVHVQKNIFCGKWMKYNLDILDIPPHNFSFHWAPITGKDWSKSRSTLCSFALPIPNELTFSSAFLCCTLRHSSLNKLFSGITVALFYLHWLLGTTFSLLLISLCDIQLQMKHRPIVHLNLECICF